MARRRTKNSFQSGVSLIRLALILAILCGYHIKALEWLRRQDLVQRHMTTTYWQGWLYKVNKWLK